MRGRIGYIDPQVNPDTRTAKVRVEVPNPRGELRLGMFADVLVSGAPGASTAMVPRSATQNLGDRTVVYVADPKDRGKFTEREVRLGNVSGERVQVVSGVQPGDLVVTAGSFFLRAERERLGLRPATGAAGGSRASAQAGSPGAPDTVQTAKVVVNEQGFEPAKLSLRAGTPARLTFLRTTDKTCGTEVVFPSLNIKRTLPLNQPVEIEFTPSKTGEIAFVCGMNMLKGVVVVE
jgi:plastocyanin